MRSPRCERSTDIHRGDHGGLKEAKYRSHKILFFALRAGIVFFFVWLLKGSIHM